MFASANSSDGSKPPARLSKYVRQLYPDLPELVPEKMIQLLTLMLEYEFLPLNAGDAEFWAQFAAICTPAPPEIGSVHEAPVAIQPHVPDDPNFPALGSVPQKPASVWSTPSFTPAPSAGFQQWGQTYPAEAKYSSSPPGFATATAAPPSNPLLTYHELPHTSHSRSYTLADLSPNVTRYIQHSSVAVHMPGKASPSVATPPSVAPAERSPVQASTTSSGLTYKEQKFSHGTYTWETIPGAVRRDILEPRLENNHLCKTHFNDRIICIIMGLSREAVVNFMKRVPTKAGLIRNPNHKMENLMMYLLRDVINVCELLV
ncbi:MAG: hypothetical protein WDW38_003936 [Sanguina aurantia]